ncbi:MAG TPA: protein translocase subunit SecF [Candidatus Limnocylindrales bacterium]
MFDVIGKRNWFFLFSGLILVPGLIFIALTPITNGKQGLQFSVDYTGCTEWQIQFAKKDVQVVDVQKILVAQGITDATVSEDSAHNFTILSKDAFLLPAPTPTPTIDPSAKASAAAASASASSAIVQASASAAQASASAAQASASAAAAPTGTPMTPEASAAAASAAAAKASASAATASQSAAVASASASAAQASPSPSPTATPNSVDQNGKSCSKHLPESGPLADAATAFAADTQHTGPIACTLLTNTVGPIVSQELIQQAILLILLGSLGILIWVGIRFGSVKFGATALAALLHDVIVVVGIFAILGTLFGVQIDALFVTAMLTVIGFSVHDTIVVYDRIRENKARHAGEPFDAIVNHSILQTFGRSINTSLTVVVTLTALLLFAGASIHYFVLALLIGIISGTYSSIFNASPLLVVWQLWDDRRRAERLAALRGSRRA